MFGTITVCIGLALSSHIIEGSTSEYDFVVNPAKSVPIQILTIQFGANVGEQKLAPFASVCEPVDVRVRVHVSRPNGHDYRQALCPYRASRNKYRGICHHVHLHSC